MNVQPFDVDVDGRIVADQEKLRRVTSWMMRHYAEDVRRNGGDASGTLMGFIAACGESVRIREVLPPAEALSGREARIWITVAEAAERFGCSDRWVRERARKGTLPARRFGGVWQIDATNFWDEG